MTTHFLLVNGRAHDGPRPEIVPVPRAVAVCPECGGRLFLQVDAWATDTGVPEDGAIHLDCEREPDPDDDSIEAREREHRSWQGEWMPVIVRVERWARRHVRVAPAPSSQEAPRA